jgi:hypothetical protein
LLGCKESALTLHNALVESRGTQQSAWNKKDKVQWSSCWWFCRCCQLQRDLQFILSEHLMMTGQTCWTRWSLGFVWLKSNNNQLKLKIMYMVQEWNVQFI